MLPTNNAPKLILGSLALIACGAVVYFVLPMASSSLEYNSTIPANDKQTQNIKNKSEASTELKSTISDTVVPASTLPVTHISTPEKVKAVYLSAWVAGNTKYRNPIIKMIDETELNSVVIDIKDSTGKLSFPFPDPDVSKYGAAENRIADIRALTHLLHQKNIYIIGRVSVFQDPHMTKLKPQWSITKKSDGTVWKDRKGLSFLNPVNGDVHKYIVAIGRGAYAEGFDEINFDYIRYPSDGNMKDINYNIVAGSTRADNLEAFFKYLSTEMKKETNIPISADLFGLTTEVTNDMGIGQVWESALPYFDFLAPMVYPSHYPSGSSGYKNPAQYPYEIVHKALASAVLKTKKAGQDTDKIRPWLQDFNLGATYTKDMVRAQMKATYDNGLDSWMLWDPSNSYTYSALLLETRD